jgi:hypothetical protein
MNYEYAEPYLEIDFRNGNKVRIKRSTITDIYSYKENGESMVKVSFDRGNSSTWYKFTGTLEEFEQNSKIVYL